MYEQMGTYIQGFIVIIKTTFYLLKINKITNKKYLRDTNFVMHFYWHICICEICFLASR